MHILYVFLITIFVWVLLRRILLVCVFLLISTVSYWQYSHPISKCFSSMNHVKWRVLHGLVDSSVIHICHERKYLVPVLLILLNIHCKHWGKCMVKSFHHIIGLRMVCSGGAVDGSTDVLQMTERLYPNLLQAFGGIHDIEQYCGERTMRFLRYLPCSGPLSPHTGKDGQWH